jgi:carboxylesterase
VPAVPVQPGSEPFSFEGGKVGALMVHGFTGSPYSMRPWGSFLADAGLTVLGPRLPGHGTRWQEMNLTRWQDWYGEVERGFDTLRGRCDQVFVMGLSMGGTLALRLAEEKGDDLAGVVTVNAATPRCCRTSPRSSRRSRRSVTTSRSRASPSGRTTARRCAPPPHSRSSGS